jgi:hypothetical protein
MRCVRFGIAGLLFAWAAASEATTIIIYIEPMTLERHTFVIDTPGRDRLLMCMAPPAVGGCTEVPINVAQRR